MSENPSRPPRLRARLGRMIRRLRLPLVGLALALPAPAAAQAPPAPPPTGTPAPAPPPPTVPGASGPTLGVVQVHIESPEPVQLLRHPGPGLIPYGGYRLAEDHERFVCDAPCDRVVNASPGMLFLVQGEDIPSSPSFELSGRSTVHVEVDPGSTDLQRGATVMTTLGVIAMLAGATLLVIGAAADEDADIGPVIPLGAGSLGGGALLLGGGIAMTVSADTHVTLR